MVRGEYCCRRNQESVRSQIIERIKGLLVLAGAVVEKKLAGGELERPKATFEDERADAGEERKGGGPGMEAYSQLA